MLRAQLSPALRAILISATVLAGPAQAQDTAAGASGARSERGGSDAPGAIHHMPFPGGLRGALASINDRVPPDRSQFLLEFIRRTYNSPPGVENIQRDATLQSLLAQLDRSNGSPSAPEETVPLPLPASLWIDAVFGGRETPQTLARAILRSRDAALLYYGLFSLDDATRAWLAAEPQLVTDLASQHSAAFLVAAPGIRVRGTALQLPGGHAAEPAWEALVGRRANEPAAFVRALLSGEEGRLAFFFGTLAQLTPEQQRLALHLESSDVAGRVAAVRRLQAVFGRATAGWRIADRVFWRPAIDPALLITELRTGPAGQLALPGARRFWTAVLAGDRDNFKSNGDGAHAAFTDSDPVDLLWLCEQVFTGDKTEDRRRYQLVLFASRLELPTTPDTATDAVEVIRAAHTHPALIATLERAKLADVRAFASAVRRAARIGAIEDRERAERALAQFQGALALVTRAAVRGGLRPNALAGIVSSLSAVQLTDRGDYEGQLVRWLVGWTEAHLRKTRRTPELDVPVAGPLERDVLHVLAGPAAVEPRFVDWEGTRYRLDFARAEGIRVARLLGDQARPFLSSAQALVAVADTLGADGLTGERLRKEAEAFTAIAEAVAWDRAESWTGTNVYRRHRDVAAALQRAAQDADVRGGARLAPALLVLADDLLARGLMEAAYAVALGHPDRASISADEAARRHDFGLNLAGSGRSAAWALPSAGAALPRGWHVIGSLLGLDLRLADFSLLRLSSRPLQRKPSLDDDQRRVLIETVALIEAASLTDTDRDTILAAMRNGRARLAAVRTAQEAEAMADEIRLSPLRRALLPWMMTIANERERVEAFLSPIELLWLGLERVPVAPSLHAWGVSGEPRLGCHCLRLVDRQPLEILGGRWHSGIFATGFPDLNLRLAELLAELQMPAPLLAPVLAAAMLDLVDTATTRDSDDRRGLVEFVRALRPERVEQYLALLTTDGPLVPVDSGGAR